MTPPGSALLVKNTKIWIHSIHTMCTKIIEFKHYLAFRDKHKNKLTALQLLKNELETKYQNKSFIPYYNTNPLAQGRIQLPEEQPDFGIEIVFLRELVEALFRKACLY